MARSTESQRLSRLASSLAEVRAADRQTQPQAIAREPASGPSSMLEDVRGFASKHALACVTIGLITGGMLAWVTSRTK